MCPFSDSEIDDLLANGSENTFSHVDKCGDAALMSYILEETRLSQKISDQQLKAFEDEFNVVNVENLLIQSSQDGGQDETHASRGNRVSFASPNCGTDEHSRLLEFPGEIPATELISTDHLPTATFTSRGQSRTGSHHGRAGRRKGSGFQVRRNYCDYAKSVLCNRMLSLYTMDDCHALDRLVKELLNNESIAISSSNDLEKFKDQFIGVLQRNIRDYPYTIQELPFCVLGVSARFSKYDSISSDTFGVRGSMSRHLANTWLDCNGGLRCTCLGDTQYSIFARNSEFDTPSCEHTQTFHELFEYLGDTVFGTPCLSNTSIFATLSSRVSDLINPSIGGFPFFRYMHRNQTIVLVCVDDEKESEICWVPMRCVQRKGMKFLCAFCDSVSTNACHHIKAFSAIRMNHPNMDAELFEDDIHFSPDNEQNSSMNVPDSSRSGPISFLPVSPVSCEMALRTELTICEKVRENKSFTLSAPSHCIHCGAPAIADTEKRNASGLIMCSVGACKMEVVTMQCNKYKKRYSPEGKSEGVFLESLCSAATHALLRKELLGFALGNGTLNSRLNQLHSHLAALEDSNMFPNLIPCLSSNTMIRMCTAFAKLAVIDPPEELFWCSICQLKTDERVSVPRLLCMDGIWAGYLRTSKKAFSNVFFIPKETRKEAGMKKTPSRQALRPRTTLVRLERAVTFLILAIEAKKIEVSTTTINAAIVAVRIINSSVLPDDFYSTSVCARTATDFEFDVGVGLLHKIQKLTSSIFDERTLLYRLLCPILHFFQGLGKRQKSRKKSSNPASLENLISESLGTSNQKKNSARKKRKKALDSDSCCVILSNALQLSPLGKEDSDSVPWNTSISTLMRKDDTGKKTLNLYRSLLQGPITHLFPRNQLNSARILAASCIKEDPEVFMKDMVKKEKYNALGTSNDTNANVTESNRILVAGLFSAAVVDTTIHSSSTSRLLPSFGNVLQEAISVVNIFYEFFEEGLNELSDVSIASEYAKEWSSRDYRFLRNKFKEFTSTTPFQNIARDDYDDAYTTGTFFPSFPQVRPLFFNTEGNKASDLDQYGFCSKHYWQVKGSFTPGAVTFCCGCTHPIVLGFKVLGSDEGPRAILDILISRFTHFPRYLIYDFACGLYKSAVHSLWWAIGESTLVSDPFHGGNHKCSPFFKKEAHKMLDMSNTISHEQRNRPISKIKNSLQQTSHCDILSRNLYFSSSFSNYHQQYFCENQDK